MHDPTKTIIQSPELWEKWRQDVLLNDPKEKQKIKWYKIRCWTFRNKSVLKFKIKKGNRIFLKSLGCLFLGLGGAMLVLYATNNSKPLARNDWEQEHMSRIEFTHQVLAVDGRFKPEGSKMGLIHQAIARLATKASRDIHKSSANNQGICRDLNPSNCANRLVVREFNAIEATKHMPSSTTFRVVVTKDELAILKAARAIALDLGRYEEVGEWEFDLDLASTKQALNTLSKIRGERLPVETAIAPPVIEPKPKVQPKPRPKTLLIQRGKVAIAKEE